MICSSSSSVSSVVAPAMVTTLDRADEAGCCGPIGSVARSEEHTSELQSLMRISYAVFCLKKKKNKKHQTNIQHNEKTEILDDKKQQQYTNIDKPHQKETTQT